MGIMLLRICEGTNLLYSDMLTQNLDTKGREDPNKMQPEP